MRGRLPLVLVPVGLLLVLVTGTSAGDGLSGTIGAPVSRVAGALRTSGDRLLGADDDPAPDTAARIQALEHEVHELRERLHAMEQAALPDEALEIGLRPPTARRLDAAVGLRHDADPLRRSMTVHRGTEVGIRRGMAVVHGGDLLGVVRGEGLYASRVELLRDPATAIGAVVPVTDQAGRPSRAVGVVRSEGDRLVLDMIDLTREPRPGSGVWTVGQTGIPAGLRIGTVAAVEAQAGRLHWRIEIEPAVEPDDVLWVAVVVPPQRRLYPEERPR